MKAFFLIFCSALIGMAGLRPVVETTLSGIVKDNDSKEALVGVGIQVTKDRKLVKRAVTDVEGKYSIQLEPGTYEIEFNYVGYTSQKIVDVRIKAEEPNILDINLATSNTTLQECVVVGYSVSRKSEVVSSVLTVTATPAGRAADSGSDSGKARKKESFKAEYLKAMPTAAPSTTTTVPTVKPVPVSPTTPPSDDRVEIDGVMREVRVAFDPETYEERIEVVDEKVSPDENPYRGNRFLTKKLDPETGRPVEKDELGRLKVIDTPDRVVSNPGIPEAPAPRAGLLTAGEWNDLHNWNKHWLDLLADGEITQYETMYGFFPKNRYTILLTNAQDFPVADVVVQLHTASGALIWEARTDNTGEAELWSGLFDQKEITGLRAEAWVNGKKHDLGQPKVAKDGVNRHQINVDCQSSKNVDIVWAVDATGSMGDEIEYLKSELLDVIGRAKDRNPELAFRMGTVFYRDQGDDYITKTSGLSPDITKTVEFIQKQFAGGGGDYPEAVHSALEEAIFSQKWSENAIARICFLVLDASPHQSPEVNASLQRSIREAARLGIRIVPVTASGIQKDTEFLMKFFGLATNGTYVFLTDDSGIGGKHIAPTTDEYKVELLDDLLVRLITEYTTIKTCNGQSAIAFEDPQAQPNQPQPTAWQALYYPNPANTQFTLDLPFAVQSVTIYDAEGQAVRKLEKPQAGQNTVNISDLAPGFYTIRILKDGRMQSGKLMVVRS